MALIPQAQDADDSGQFFHPALRAGWSVEVCPGAGLVLRSEDDIRYASGTIMEALAPLLDGSRTVHEIELILADRFNAAAVCAALEELNRIDCLRNGPERNRSEAPFWASCGHDPDDVERRRPGANVEVIGVGANGAMVCDALAALGIRTVHPARLRIVVAPDYLDANLRKLNAEALETGQPWLLVRPSGRRQWIGPLLTPGRGPCWECMANALQANGWGAEAFVGGLPTAAAVVQTLAAQEAAKWLLARPNPTVEGCICEIDTASLTTRRHAIRRRPQCPACGSGPQNEPVPLTELISPYTGVVTDTELIFADPALSVYTSGTSQVVRPDGAGNLLYCRRGSVSGKGQTPQEALTRCLAEAVERYSTQWHGDEAIIRTTQKELGDGAIPPDILLGFSDAQRRAGTAPASVAADETIDWIAARSVTSGRIVYLPAAYCFFGYGIASCGADSSGCAAAPAMEEALVRGLLECIERDALAIWWYNRLALPAIPPDSLSERASRLAEVIGARVHRLRVFDITHDLEVPVSVAVAQVDNGGILLGSAAALTGERAVWHALAELAAHIVEGDPPAHAGSVDWIESAGETSTPADVDTADPLNGLVEACARESLEVIAVDMTRPDIAFPVIRTVVPGLRSTWPRFAPGRLYEVPVTLGWKQEATQESELNDVPFPR